MKPSFKKLMASLLVAVMILSVSPVDTISRIDFASLFSIKAVALTSGDFTYEVSGENATITGYSGTASNLTIPSKLDGKTVVAIKHSTFANNANLKSVSLPGTLTTLGTNDTYYSGVFQDCKKLEKVTFEEGKSNATIGTETFMGCLSLQSVTLPKNYVTIYRDAFKGCTLLNTFILKQSDSTVANQTIETNAFNGCSALETISLPTTLKYIGTGAFAGTAIKNLVIPEGVTTIDHGAFSNCNYLISVSLPGTLTKLGVNDTYYTGVFQNCKKLETVTFAAGSKDATIGTETFASCASLKTITIPGNYTTIYRDAFLGCTALESLVYEKSDYSYANQTIETNAFNGCSALETISLPTTLKYIGTGAFAGTAIKNLVIPEGVTTIDHGAFSNCNYLISVSLPGTLTKLGVNDTYYTGVFQNCKKLETVTFAAGSKDATIGTETFASCASLKTITIPGNYTAIYKDAFLNCTALESLEYEKSDYSYANQTIETNTFKGCSALETVSLPTTLKYIGVGAFEGTAIKNLVIPEGVTTIDYGAFVNCNYLISVSLPGTLTTLGVNDTYYSGVFQNCPKLETVIFAEGEKDLTIGTETFKSCPALTTVHLPLNLVSVNKEAFSGSTENLTICSISNSSFGKTYADSNSIKFKLCGGHNILTIGDVNGDGNINSSDALLVLQHAVKKITLTGNAFTAADTNKDEQLNSSDALKILQFSVGKIKEF